MSPLLREPRRRTGLSLLVAPLSCYLAMTIGIPMVNGAAAESGFREHALTTLAVTGAITAAVLGLRRILVTKTRGR